ncbi:tyrosine-type recombinase/integrase [Paenibacillus sp. GM2]|uniref:tyrosine-type recombinase/integrase n=1 Tax=Paenibacillus sp. GM2 TaxID=1622070 RepID=UPI00083802FE|nr:site-specific integrase [Paenibacillus sp. GM2]
MKGHFYKPHCKCPKDKKCKCGATWSYIIDIGTDPATGRRKQKKKGGFKTKGAAQEAAALVIAELSEGTFVDEQKVTFEDFAKEWLQGYMSTGRVKISTKRIRKQQINLLNLYLAKLKMHNISKKNYQDALNDLKKEDYADNTINGTHSTGRMIFKRAIDLGVIKNDPTATAIVPKTIATVEDLEKKKELPKYMEKEELAKFLKTAEVRGLERDYPMFLLLAYTGMRSGELCALKWQDVDFEGHTISITKTHYSERNVMQEYVLLTPKTRSSRRVIDVEEFVLGELKLLKVKQDELKAKRLKSGLPYHDKDFVFAQFKNRYPGYPTYQKFVEQRMTRLLKIAGLNEKLTPHSLRHTHTSLLAEAGASLEQIMQRLGHSDDETTRRIYLHITKPQKKEASHKFAELMRSF